MRETMIGIKVEKVLSILTFLCQVSQTQAGVGLCLSCLCVRDSAGTLCWDVGEVYRYSA